jgi:hypothetical protein
MVSASVILASNKLVPVARNIEGDPDIHLEVPLFDSCCSD